MAPERLPALPPRLAAVAALVPAGARTAEIGCDRAPLTLHLAATGHCEACWATEVDETALANARRSPGASAWAGRISWRAGNGLEPIDPGDRIDTIILAGLGASAIVRILATPRLALLAPRRIIAQPQTEVAGLRRWIIERGWAIVAERVVPDRGRSYEIFAAEPGDGRGSLAHPDLPPEDVLAVGPVLLRSGRDEVLAIWESRSRRLERIVASGARGAMADRAAREAARARRILAALRGRPLTWRDG